MRPDKFVMAEEIVWPHLLPQSNSCNIHQTSASAPENAENILVIHDRELADRYIAYIDGLVKRHNGQEQEIRYQPEAQATDAFGRLACASGW
jgi:hypothetical protein